MIDDPSDILDYIEAMQEQCEGVKMASEEGSSLYRFSFSIQEKLGLLSDEVERNL